MITDYLVTSNPECARNSIDEIDDKLIHVNQNMNLRENVSDSLKMVEMSSSILMSKSGPNINQSITFLPNLNVTPNSSEITTNYSVLGTF